MKEKNLVYSPQYHHMKNDGKEMKDIDAGIRRFMKCSNDGLSYAQLRKNYENANLNKLFNEVCKQFEKLYGMEMPVVELINRYQNGICVFAYTSKFYPAVYVDELFESTIQSFLMISFLWAEFKNDPAVWQYSFKYMLYVFHEQCILGEMASEEDIIFLTTFIIQRDSHILDLVSDCYWAIMTFCLAHEVAHIYYKQIGRCSKTDKQCRKEEFDADRIAYDVLLHMIMDDMEKAEQDRVLYEHACLAPMILMEYFDLYYYTDRVMYKKWIEEQKHPNPIKRKNQLFGILYQPEYVLETNEAHALFHAILDATDKGYKDNLLLKMERGKLKSILDYERRENFNHRRREE